MMQNRFEIFRGREVEGQLTGLRICGYAYLNESEPYYRVKLFFLPENTYYLSKNQGAGYTIFSKITLDQDGKVIFQNPVGFARMMEQVKTHLYLRFPDLGSHMFMCLYPIEKAQAAA